MESFSAFLLMIAAAASDDRGEKLARFRCLDDVRFAVRYTERRAWVTTSAKTYQMSRRRFSIGRKYSNAQASFIQDEERGVLTGAAGGPFRRCVEEGPQAAGDFPR